MIMRGCSREPTAKVALAGAPYSLKLTARLPVWQAASQVGGHGDRERHVRARGNEYQAELFACDGGAKPTTAVVHDFIALR